MPDIVVTGFMTPGEKLPLPTFPASFVGAKYYAEELFPRLPERERPLHCVQQPGELMYVPEGWYHCTYNLDSSVAVAAQNLTRGPTTADFQLQFEFNAARTPEDKLHKLQSIDDAQPDHAGVHFTRANGNGPRTWSVSRGLKELCRGQCCTSTVSTAGDKSTKRWPRSRSLF